MIQLRQKGDYMAIVLKGNINVFEQIVNNYKKLISTGVLKDGEFLPSCRELAKELGVNPNTVAKAYKRLEDDGYATSVLKKGYYVSYGKDNSKSIDNFKEHLAKLKSEGITLDEINNAINDIYGSDKK